MKPLQKIPIIPKKISLLPAKIIRRLSGQEGQLDHGHMAEALNYIDVYWANLTYKQAEDKGTVIGLPNPYIVPAADPRAAFAFREQYYWDSYFVALGLAGTKHQPMAEGMLDNLLVLQKRFGFIPNASRMYFMSRSQPPMLTSYIRLIYQTGNKNHQWLADRMAHAEEEYKKVWTSSEHPFWHKVYGGLSRYYDINVLHDLAEAESGWDMTTRFERRCLDYLPIDLNCLLYKYETDFAWAADELGHKKDAVVWRHAASARRRAINKLLWNKRKHFYFDYNFVKREQGAVWSLAAFFAMWAGVASPEQAAYMVENMRRFKHAGGLSTTTKPLIDTSIFGSLKTQWAYPNGWAPLHYIVIEGLRSYGYEAEAEELARKWLRTNLRWFERHGVFQEKYNVVKPDKHPVEGLYPSQTGFGWTNAIFARLAKEYMQHQEGL